jgi:flagellar motor switch protein FliN
MELLTLNTEQPATAKGKARTKASSLKSLNPDVLHDMDVSLTAIVGHGRLTVSQLLDLSSGSVIDLDTPLDGRVELRLNDRVVALGELVAVEDKFGVRITQIVFEQE